MRTFERSALAGRLLRAHVAQRAEQIAGARQPGAGVKLRQAEIGDPEVAAAVDEQVGGLDVAVDDAELMGMLQRLGGLDREAGERPEEAVAARCPLRRELCRDVADVGRHRRVRAGQVVQARRRLGGPKLVDQLGEVLALDELHGVVVDAAFAADGVDGHNIGVVQRRGGLGLVLESLQLLGVERRRERQHLEGDAPAER